MDTLIGTRRHDIDNPAVEALPFRARVGEIMESGAFLGYQLDCHDTILAVRPIGIVPPESNANSSAAQSSALFNRQAKPQAILGLHRSSLGGSLILFSYFLQYNVCVQILVVEDEEKIANFLRRGLMEESYAVDVAYDGEDALYKFDINEYDLVILDLMIPKVDGLTVCQRIREVNTDVPILVLTAKDATEDKVKGLDAGADDYVTKPFSFSELSARVRALLRRGKKADPAVLTIDNLSLDPATRTAKRGKRTITLTTREYALLEYFMRNPNRVLTKTELLEHVWDYNYDGLSNVLETYVKYLRKKLNVHREEKELIHTMRGSGYVFR
jgi:DNA-binding response OmpR family regulator